MRQHGLSEGTFLVRPRGNEFPGEYVLSVVYKGKATHHLVKQSGQHRATFTVNNNPIRDCVNLPQV